MRLRSSNHQLSLNPSKFDLRITTGLLRRQLSPKDPSNSTSLSRKGSLNKVQAKKTLTVIEENSENPSDNFLHPQRNKASSSALLKMKEIFQFKQKKTLKDNEKTKQLAEIAKIMKGNHDIYFKKRDHEDFESDYKQHYESQYRKQRALVSPSYFLDVVEFSSKEKTEVYSDSWPWLPFRRRLLFYKTTGSLISQKITNHPYFKLFAIMLIWVNSLIFCLNKLGLIDNYLDSEFYNVIIWLFFVEIVLKLLSQGPGFFRGWINTLDFMIVVLAFGINFLDNAQMTTELQILASLIIIRPLTTLISIQGFQLIACAVSSAIPLLKESLIILLFFLLIFTISGVHLFSGYLKKRCFFRETGLFKSPDDPLCEDDSFCEFEGFPKEAFICGKLMENPNWDLTSFDTFFYAFLVVFQTSTLGAWNDIMIEVQETFSVFSSIYFVIIVVIGALVLLNMILSVLKVKFTEYKNEMNRNTNKKNGSMRRYSFQKLRKMKVFIGNQGKKRLLMDKGKNVLMKIKGLNKLKFGGAGTTKDIEREKIYQKRLLEINNHISPILKKEKEDLINTSIEHPKPTHEPTKTPRQKSTDKLSPERNHFLFDKQKTSNTSREKSLPSSKLNKDSHDESKPLRSFANLMSSMNKNGLFGKHNKIVSEPPDKSQKSISPSKLIHSLKFQPIKLPCPHNLTNFSEGGHTLTTTEAPLLTTEIDDMLLSQPKSPWLQKLARLEDSTELKVEALFYSKHQPDSALMKKAKATITFNDLERDFPPPRTNQVLPLSPELESFVDRASFQRISHGFSFVKERRELQKALVREEAKNNEEKIPIDSDFDLDYDDPDLPLIKQLNPKHLKLEADPEKPYESTSTSDILPEGIRNKESPFHRRKSPLPKLQYALNYSKRFYKENIASLLKAKNRERNLTRLLLAGQTIKKLNRMKLPLMFSLETEFFSKQLRETGLMIRSPQSATNTGHDSYFYRVQNIIRDKKKSLRPASKAKTIKKTIRETLNFPLSNITNIKDQDINDVKKLYFGESEFMLGRVSDSEASSSDDDEVERAVTRANEEAIAKPQNSSKASTSALLQNLRLGYFLKSREEQWEGDEAKKQKIIKKAKERQEFKFTEIIDMKLQEKEKENEQEKSKENSQKPVEFWSGEDVFDYSMDFYRYSNEGVHIVKRLRRLIRGLNYNVKNYDIWEAGFVGKVNFIRKKVTYLVNSDKFIRLMLFLVLINTILLSLNGIISLDPSGIDKITTANTVFTLIFTVEVVLKLTGLGVYGYFNDRFNLFDCFIVVISLVEWIVLTDNKTSFSAFRALSFFRTIRILRVSRLLRGLKYANILAEKISDSLQNCLKIFLILLIFIYIYALLGMAIYQGVFVFTEIRQNFESFPNSLIIVFQLITLSNWNLILYGCLRTPISKFFSMLYLSSAVVIGNYLLLNLLLAILLDVFAKDSSTEVKNLLDSHEVGEDLILERERKILENLNGEDKAKEEDPETNKKYFKRFLRKFTKNFKTIAESDSPGNTGNFELLELESLLEKEKCEKSYYLFSRTNSLRILCARILKTSVFQFFVQLTIALSMVQLILYTYLYDKHGNLDESMKAATLSFELFINAFFLAEFLLETTFHGFTMHWNKPWTRLNTIILGASLIFLILDEVAPFGKFMGYIHPFRIIVVLRAFSFNERYRTMISALLQSIKAITSLVFMILLIWLMFAIIGVSFLQGKMGYCEVDNPYNISRDTCENELHEEWKIRHNNFDNVLNGLLTLFVLSFFEGFPALVYQFSDAGGEDTGPSPNNSQYMIIFFVVFAVVSAIFLMNLFICVIFMHYIIAEKREKTTFLSEEQIRWIAIQRLLVKETPDYSYVKLPDGHIRRFFYRLTKARAFEVFIFLCIGLNTIAMAIYYEGCPRDYQAILRQVNLSITIIFIVEACLKVVAMGLGGYFYSGWNKLDFFVVLTSIFDVWLEFSNESEYQISTEITRVLRVLKVARLLRLIKSYSGLQKLFLTSVYSLPYLINAFSILFLVYFMFTVLSVFLFRDIT